MRRLVGLESSPRDPFARLRQQRRPGRVGSVARRRRALLIAAGNIDGVERRSAITARIAEEHQHASVRRPSRAFVMVALGQNAFARTIRLDNANGEAALELLGEGDVVAAWRPDRRRIGALAEADALRRSALRTHDINLLATATIGFETD